MIILESKYLYKINKDLRCNGFDKQSCKLSVIGFCQTDNNIFIYLYNIFELIKLYPNKCLDFLADYPDLPFIMYCLNNQNNYIFHDERAFTKIV